jgi:hypothetical protein
MSQQSKPTGAAAPVASHPSHEDNPVSITPKDLEPGDAAACDQIERRLDSPDPDERQQELLDDAIELSFPASDPPALTGGVTRIEKPAATSPQQPRP